jgi:putative oxygen-independent coproporphyrinogen III oxidase
VQSFHAAHLSAIGRVHDADEAREAAAAALEIFGNVNLDLMFALPRQTLDEARADLEAAIAFRPPHLSFYHLTLEPNTLFARHPPPLPDEDTAADMGDMIEAALAQAGYAHYETSAFAKPGSECRHNLNYWRFGDYLGIGAGAHSKLSFPDRVVRQVRARHPRDYLDRATRVAPIAEEHEVSRGDIGFEFMLNALRLTEGVPASLFAERTGFSLAIVDKQLAEAENRGLLVRDHERIHPTPVGRRFLNDLQALFLPIESPSRSKPIGCVARSS